LQTSAEQKEGQTQWYGSYNSASGTLFRLKLTEDIEQKLKKTMLALFDHQSVFTQIKRLFLVQLEKTIVTKQHFSKKE